MSTFAVLTPQSLPAPPRVVRRRKPSFSTPSRAPPRSPRTMTRNSPLQRTTAYLSLSEFFTGSSPADDILSSFPTVPNPSPLVVRFPRSLQKREAHRLRGKAQSPIHAGTWDGRTQPKPKCPLTPRPTSPRTTSPLSPAPCPAAPRPSFPRSKPAPDLYRSAITGHMRSTPHGKKILNMGARLAITILTATQELERIVVSQLEAEADVVMADANRPLTKSWVVLPDDDWEMVDASPPPREMVREVAVA